MYDASSALLLLPFAEAISALQTCRGPQHPFHKQGTLNPVTFAAIYHHRREPEQYWLQKSTQEMHLL